MSTVTRQAIDDAVQSPAVQVLGVLCTCKHLLEKLTLDFAHLPLSRFTSQVTYPVCSSSPTCPCLCLRMVSAKRWFPAAVNVTQRQFVVLAVRMQNPARGVCLPFC